MGAITSRPTEEHRPAHALAAARGRWKGAAQHQGRANSRPLLIVTLTGLAAAALLSPAAATAQDTKPAAGAENPLSEVAKRRLEQRRRDLDAAEKRAKSIQSDVTELAAEREKVNAKLQETAALIQKSEGRLTSTEEKLAGLEQQEVAVRATLEKNRDKITKLMAALQRMGRNPPPVLYTQRTDALQMVRSAMLLASAYPELRKDANELGKQLGELISVKQSIEAERDQLRSETQRLSDARTRLTGLMETKRRSLDERQGELEQVRKAAAELSRGVGDLNELIGKLDQAVAANTGLGAYDAEARKAGTPSTAAAGAAAAGVKPDTTKPDATKPDATKPEDRPVDVAMAPSAIKPTIVELAPQTAAFGAASPNRLQPAIPFHLAKARLPLPAFGKRALAFGDKTQYGGQSKGIVIETRFGGQVTSPSDGWVVYAGEFRSYGQLLIINAGNGYHVLLAGMSQIDVQPGQFVLAAEPVGTMATRPRTGKPPDGKQQDGQAQPSAPVLYIEFRKDGRPIDPDPWWSEGHRKVQG